jgi:hypothetical protein
MYSDIVYFRLLHPMEHKPRIVDGTPEISVEFSFRTLPHIWQEL